MGKRGFCKKKNVNIIHLALGLKKEQLKLQIIAMENGMKMGITRKSVKLET